MFDTLKKEPVSIRLRPGDQVFINQTKSLAKHLQKDDRVKVEYQPGKSGGTIAVLYADRPEEQQGIIKSIDKASRQFTLAVGSEGKLVDIRVPDSARIRLNDRETSQGKPVTFGDLRQGDQVTVQHVADDLQPEKEGRAASSLSVLREMTSEGTIREVDRRQLILETAGRKPESWPFKEKAAIWINGADKREDQSPLRPADLKAGEKVRVTHDTHITRVDVDRVIELSGIVQTAGPKMLEVRGKDKTIPFLLDAQTKITLAGEPAEATDVRTGDLADVSHKSPLNAPNPLALTVTARRPPDRSRWALLIGIQKYDDAKLSGLTAPAADARLLQETLLKRQGVPPSQTLLLEDVSLVRLKEGIPAFLDQVPADGKLIVYFGGHALRDDEGRVYLAPKEFNREQMAATGLSLQWLVDRLEQCKAKEKLLLLDACQAVAGPRSAEGAVHGRDVSIAGGAGGKGPPAHRDRPCELLGRAAGPRAGGREAWFVRLGAGGGILRPRRQEPRRPPGADGAVHLSRRVDGSLGQGDWAAPIAQALPARQPPAPAVRRCQTGAPRAGRLLGAGLDQSGGGQAAVCRCRHSGGQGARGES